jgi:hypothetical protein
MADDVKQLLRLIRQAGCTIESGGKKHKCWLPGGKRFVTVSKTPSNQNFVHRVRADFRRLGIELGNEQGKKGKAT